jgi:hypothetical protein
MTAGPIPAINDKVVTAAITRPNRLIFIIFLKKIMIRHSMMTKIIATPHPVNVPLARKSVNEKVE